MNRRENLIVRAISFVERPANFFLMFSTLNNLELPQGG